MASLLSQLQAAAVNALEQRLAGRILLTVGILVAGFLIAKLGGRLTRYLQGKRGSEDVIERVRGRRRSADRVVEYIIVVITLVAAMVTINASATSSIVAQVSQHIPGVITALLLFTLGVVLVRGIVAGIDVFIEHTGIKEHAVDIGVSANVITAFLKTVKLLLYLVVFELAIIQLGVPSRIITDTVTAASYGVVLLLVLLGFYGFRDLIRNYAAGIYLRSSNVLEPGKRVKVDDESGEVRDISMFSTTISTDSGYFMLSPNTELMGKSVKFKRVKAEIDTLEDIKDYFVAESSPYDGAASCEMGLAIFGFDITQGDISEELEQEHPAPEALGDAIETLTDSEVRAAFVDADKITDLALESKIWFNNEALILPYFNKEVLFPGADTEHYVLSVGAEGEELLVVDPTTGESGGVYYADGEELQHAMERVDGGGYLVLAPRGTTAFWRIKNDLIYSNLSLYRQLSKSLEVQLSKILRRGEVLKEIVPESVDDFIDRWTEDGGRVRQMWSPEEGGDTKLDEFTDHSE